MERVMQGFDGEPNFRMTPDFRITRVWAKNFRSIADVSFELDPLTILVGPNASGKSNLLDVLRFIKDALRDLEVAVSGRQSMEGVARHGAGDLDIEMGVAAVAYSRYAEGNYYSVEYGFTLASTGSGGYRVSSEYGKVREVDGSDAVEFRVEDGRLATAEFYIGGAWHPFSSYDVDLLIDFDTDRLAFPFIVRASRPLVHNSEISVTAALLHDGMRELYRNLTDMRFYHIFPNTIREPQRLSNTVPMEENAENLGAIIKKGFDRVDPGSMERLREDVRLLMPGVSDVGVDAVGGYLVVKLKHDAIAGDPWIDLSMESDGAIRLLALVVALYQQPYLPVIGIEEPELTAHPDALAVLADMINEAARRSQVIVTTHSPDLIDFLTDYRTTESLRVVELSGGVTTVRPVGDNQVKAVKKHLFSPGELYRMGEITARR
jgi:predicted ATPase